MVNWLIIALVASGYAVTLLSRDHASSQRRDKTRDRLRDAWNTSIVFGGFLALFTWASYPLDCLHAIFTDGGKKKRMIELWVLLWVTVNLIILGLLIHRFSAFVLLPVLRLADLLCVLLRVLPEEEQVNKARTFLLLLFHYIEVITIFGCLYFVEQRLFGNSVFAINGYAGEITRAQAWYFSLVTGSTLGYGDITPASLASRILIALQLLIVLLITLISIPRVFTVRNSNS